MTAGGGALQDAGRRRTPPRALVTFAGVALILCPLIAVALKALNPGWMLVVLLYASPVLIIGYVLQVVIAASAMLPPLGILRGDDGRRALIAALLTSVAVLGCGVFLVDGGDDGTYGSVLTSILGNGSTAVGEALSMSLFFVFGALLLIGWVWLVGEWVNARVQARRARRAAQQP